MRSHNHLLGEVGRRGIKTGFTRASGFNLSPRCIATAAIMVGVVLGGRSAGRA